MNGIEKITQRIDQDAQGEIDALLEQARAQAAEITARYQAQAQRESADILARGQKAADEREERLASTAQMEGKKLTLAVKQEMLDRAFALALEQLAALPEEQYVQALTALVLQTAPTGREQLIFSTKDRARVGKAVVTAVNDALPGAALTLSEQTRPMCGGFILSDGDVEVNCTFETLLRLQREEISSQVAAALFD
ncbi:MAG: V-type ATP synthase subunit E [Oscillospiraceae bacterium]|nr:V-type ATP synthase subunit E [Oscillospiraceae bacterium]